MNEQAKEHNYKVSDQQALEHLKFLMEFTTPSSIRKSIQSTFFTYLKDQSENGQDAKYNQVISDHFLLIEFLDKLSNKS